MNVLEIKHAVRKRDGYRCTECGLTQAEHVERYGKGLEVHRKLPGSEYTVDGCETVCRPCHGPKPRRKRGSANRDKQGRWLLTVTIRPDLFAAWEAIRKRNRRTKTAEVEIMMEEYIARHRAKGTE